MNNKLIAGIVVILVLAGGYWFYSSTGETKETQDSQVVMEDSMKMDDSMMREDDVEKMVMDDGETMEDHMMAMDDGETIMVMGGKMNPSTIYVAPGAMVKVANHEAIDLSIESEDGSITSEMIKSTEDGMLKAPSKPGTYTYYSSIDPEISGTLVVEE